MAAKRSIPTIKFRRKLEKRTDYKKRMGLLKSKKIRLVVRRSNKNMTVQLVQYGHEGDKVLATINSGLLEKYGAKSRRGNIMEAYLVGLLVAKKAKQLKIKEAVLDIGLHSSTKGSRIYAVAKGAAEGGLEVACSEEFFPSDDKVMGKHVEEYAKKAGSKVNFKGYEKSGVKPQEVSKHIAQIKNAIMKEN